MTYCGCRNKSVPMGLTRIYEDLKARFDDGDVDSTLDFRHVGHLRLLLSSIGCWPHKQFGRDRIDAVLSMYNLLLIFLAIVLPTLGTAYLHQHWDDLSFFDMGHVILTIFMDLMYLERLILSRKQKFREAIKELFLEFHLFYHKDRSWYSNKIYSSIHIISGIFGVYIIAMMCCGLTLFAFKPLYNNFSKGMFSDRRPANSTFEHSVYYYFPTDYVYTTERGYWILFVFNIHVSYNTVCGVCVLDFLLSLIVLQIWGHLEILKHNMQSIPQPEANDDQMGGMYSAEENIQVRRLLKDIVLHHNFIIKFVNKCSNAFSEYLFAFYLLHQVISCILLIEVSSLDSQALAMYGPLSVAMHQLLIQLSILFEITNSKSEQLIDAAYAIPWENMDTGNRKTVLFLLQRVRTPVSLKAGGMVPVGVRTMSAVLKTSVSYYMMLITVAKEQ